MNTMNTTLKKISMVGALAATALGITSASAMGFPGMNMSTDEMVSRQTTMFTQQASLIGATVDEIKNAWAEGKDFVALAKEKGITEDQLHAKMKEVRQTQMKNDLATLVSKGVITQAQADKRLATMQSKDIDGKDGGKRKMHFGMMRGMGL